MRNFLLVGVLAITSSCAFLSNMHITSYNYNLINQGESLQETINKRGNPVYQLADGNKQMHLYRDGYIRFDDGRVVGKGEYQLYLGANDLLSNNVRQGTHLFDAIIGLGLPQSVQKEYQDTVVRYKRGAFLVKDSVIVLTVDKTYPTLVFDLGINAFSDNSANSSHAYYITPGSEAVSPEDFQFKEVKSFLASSLRLQGYNVTDSPSQAKYLVMVNYGISDPKEDIQVISRPVYIPRYIPGSNLSFYGSNGSYLGAVNSGSSWGTQYAGQHTETIKTVTYSRWLNVEAVDYDYLKQTKTMKPVWKILTSSVGSSGDLRYVLPALTYGSANYINKDTRKQLMFQVSDHTLNEYIYDLKFRFPPTREVAGRK